MKKDDLAILDVDTQNDFAMPDGALYVQGAETLIPRWRAILEAASRAGVPVIASLDTHVPNDPEFETWPPHCVKGTPGHEKVPGTTLEGAKRVPLAALQADFEPGTELLVEKSIYSVFDNRATDSILAQTGRTTFAVFGLATDVCVRAAVLGLRERGYEAIVVADAVAAVDEEDGKEAMAEMERAGAATTTTEALLAALDS